MISMAVLCYCLIQVAAELGDEALTRQLLAKEAAELLCDFLKRDFNQAGVLAFSIIR